jgi:hypothetical protein
MESCAPKWDEVRLKLPAKLLIRHPLRLRWPKSPNQLLSIRLLTEASCPITAVRKVNSRGHTTLANGVDGDVDHYCGKRRTWSVQCESWQE